MPIFIKKFTALILSCSILFIIMTGCSPKPSSGNQPTPNGTVQTPVAGQQTPGNGSSNSDVAAKPVVGLSHARALTAFTHGEINQNAVRVADAINAFSVELTQVLVNDENYIASPFSIFMTLVSLANAAEGEAQQELLRALHLEDMQMSDVNDGVSRVLYAVNDTNAEQDDFQPVSIANAVFVNRDLTLDQDYAQAVMDSLRTTTFQVDFTNPTAADIINQWASDHTQGLIDKIVNASDFSADTVAAIANAIYFSDRWKAEFDPSQTKEDVFHAKTGDVNAMFMHKQGNELSYYEDDALQSVYLPFATGGGMCILLPKEGDASELMRSLTSEQLDQMQSAFVPQTGTIALPRFSMDFEAELSDALKALKLDALFNSSILTKLVKETPAAVSAALHKATIKVDEKGTTAAAVTVMIADRAALIEPSEPFEMICDKPFGLILYGAHYDGAAPILFTGVVNSL